MDQSRADGAVERKEFMTRVRNRCYTVVIDAFDGRQFGMMPLAISAASKDEAERIAVKAAVDDGWEKVRVMFTLSGG
jgi:hypothetical protein